MRALSATTPQSHQLNSRNIRIPFSPIRKTPYRATHRPETIVAGRRHIHPASQHAGPFPDPAAGVQANSPADLQAIRQNPPYVAIRWFFIATSNIVKLHGNSL